MIGKARKRPDIKEIFMCIQKASPGAVKMSDTFLAFEGMKDMKGDCMMKLISNFIGKMSTLKRYSE